MTDSDAEILAELKRIRELLTPAPPHAPEKMSLAAEFKEFLKNYKVLGLAVAFILGLYLGYLVKALVTDMILPILGLALPAGTDINSYKISVFGIGDFLNNVLTFLIVALVIFLIVKLARRWNME